MSKLVLLLPAWNHCVASTVIANGTLSLWAARGDRPGNLGTSETDAAKAHFEWPGTSLPVAALSRQFDVGDAQGSAWMRADPSYIRADMVTARMLACGNLGLTTVECASIASDLKPIFGDAGFEFDAWGSERWYLRAPVDSQLPQCANPDLAIGDDLKLHLPHGPAGRHWRQLFNETQIVLHNHPVNAARPGGVRSVSTGCGSGAQVFFRCTCAAASMPCTAIDPNCAHWLRWPVSIRGHWMPGIAMKHWMALLRISHCCSTCTRYAIESSRKTGWLRSTAHSGAANSSRSSYSSHVENGLWCVVRIAGAGGDT